MSETLKRWLLTIGHFRAVLRASENELVAKAVNIGHYQRASSKTFPSLLLDPDQTVYPR